MTVHLIKLSVGSTGIDSLQAWRDRCIAERKRRKQSLHMPHTTRMWPKREAEILDGGSIYWVIQGMILARQVVDGMKEVYGPDGVRRCQLLMAPELIPVVPTPRRPFQGWRYLEPKDAPQDVADSAAATLDPALTRELADLGLL